nr:MAG TPA: hypothetical protein [Caudoviricetes sp.]
MSAPTPLSFSSSLSYPRSIKYYYSPLPVVIFIDFIFTKK